MDVREVLNNFPFSIFRKYQPETIKEIAEAFNSGKRWVFLEAPTGHGKSADNIPFCRTMRSFYITPQNILLDRQLIPEFPNYLTPIKGRKHYTCVEIKICRRCKARNISTANQCKYCGGIRFREGNCDEDAPCIRERDYECRDKYDKCFYWRAKIQAIHSQTALTNFAYFVGESFIPENSVAPHFGNRELLIIDEGHNIDQYILDYISITVSKGTLPYPVFLDVKRTLLSLPSRLSQIQISNLLEETVDSCRDYLKMLPDKLDDEQVKSQKRALDFIRRSKSYKNNLDADWVGQIEKKVYQKGTWIRAKIQPIYVKNFMHQYLWRRAKRFIISSATIFRHNFVKECGLSNYADEICYTDIPSTFPIQNRMIVDATIGSLSWEKRKENLPLALNAVRRILAIEKHKGVIHAHSYDFAEAIKNGISDLRLMFHTSKDRDEALENFLNSSPESGRVLVAVAMTEGLDLKGNLATFQILFKCPFANYAKDLRVYRRLKELGDKEWYGIQTLKTIVQAYGRAVRSPTDKAKFYIIDSDAIRECKRWRRQLPRFFREAFDARERLT